jgi:hypothetical protein
LVAPFVLTAQDASEPAASGGFEHQGSVTFGYRFTDVKGYQPKFQELFDLRSGPRLLDFSLFGKAREGGNKFVDDYSVTASGLGGDPYSSVQLTARKSKLYDLRVNFRQSYYYWNRNDSAVLPNGLDGLSNQHNWATVRKIGSIDLLVHVTNNLRLSFEYYRNTRDGITDTTQSLDYFGSSATWGAFARANPYYLVAPVNEEANRVSGGIDYTRRSWTLHYRIGYQSYGESINGLSATASERSINVDDSTTSAESVNNISYSDGRRLTTPVSEFSYAGKLYSKLKARGGYIFYRYRGPASLDMSFDGAARTNTAGTADPPYQLSLSTRAVDTEPSHVIDQGFTYRATEWWDVLLDYRYSRFTVDSDAQFRTVNLGTIQTGASTDRWAVGTSTLDLDMAFTPAASLLLRAGVRLMKSDVENFQDGLSDPSRSKRIKTVWPIGSVYFQPSKKLSLRANVDQITSGTSYTRITPHTDVGGRFVARIRATERFYIEDSGVFRDRTLLATDFRSTVRSNAVSANYEFSGRMTVFAGFSYQSLFTRDFVTFLRGPAPITNVPLRDQTVNRVWEAGIRLAPIRGVGIDFTGNYVRTTGLGEIAGESPLFGPMTFPYATGSIYYDVPKVGRLRADLQRTYYIEEIVPGNNFGANLLTIAYTRSF